MHFDESPDQFPEEYAMFFQGKSIKSEMADRAEKKLKADELKKLNKSNNDSDLLLKVEHKPSE